MASLAIAGALAVSGCESRVSLGARCTARSDCLSELTCVGGRCREECTGPEQCATGQRCIAGPSGARACTLAPEETCSSTDPCDPALFAACREGRCVTGCTDGTTCVSGTCDTTTAVGVCVEPISSGGCLGLGTLASTRSLAEAVLGDGSVAVAEPRELWFEESGAAPMSVDDTSSFAIGALAGDIPSLMLGVHLGDRMEGMNEVVLRVTRPFDEATVHTLSNIDSAYALGQVAIDDAGGEHRLAILRPAPDARDDTFALVVRGAVPTLEGDPPTLAVPDVGVTGLHSSAPYPTIPGGLALFSGVDVDDARTLVALRYRSATNENLLEVIGERLGEGNALDTALPASWGAGAVAFSSAPQATLLYEPSSGGAAVALVPGAQDVRPRVGISPIALSTDLPPALVGTPTTPSRYRVVTSNTGCGELAIADLTCTSGCSLQAADVAVRASSLVTFEASELGQAIAVLRVTASGADVVVLDSDAAVLPASSAEALTLASTDSPDFETLTLREAHLTTSVRGGVAYVAVAGLYVDATGARGRVRVRSLRLAP